MTRNSKIIMIVLVILMLATAITVVINYSHVKNKLALLEKEEIILLEKGMEICRITLTDLIEIGPEVFEADMKSSSMLSSEKHIYTGVALSELFLAKGISLENKTKVIAGSLDGYQVPLKIEEIIALDNVFLVYKVDGDYLKGYNEAGGQGPYMIVIRGDKFSQRWAKYVVELSIE